MTDLQTLKKQKEDKFSTLIEKSSMFFAFSDEQFNENKTPLEDGDKYVSLGAGAIMPKSKVSEYLKGADEINDWYKKQIKSNKLRYKEICYQLANYEYKISGDMENVLAALGTGYTAEEVRAVYLKETRKGTYKNY